MIRHNTICFYLFDWQVYQQQAQMWVVAAAHSLYLSFTQAPLCLPNLDFPPPVTDKDGGKLYCIVCQDFKKCL